MLLPRILSPTQSKSQPSRFQNTGVPRAFGFQRLFIGGAVMDELINLPASTRTKNDTNKEKSLFGVLDEKPLSIFKLLLKERPVLVVFSV